MDAMFWFLSLLVVFFPSLCTCQSDFVSSRATFYGSPDCLGTPRGGCGYGEFGRNVNGGDVGAVAWLFRNGSGCGACYQVKCTYPGLCSDGGVNVVVTDHGASGNTDFILSAGAFTKLATPTYASELMAYGGVEIQYRRIPCQYPGYNLMFMVTEHSNYPHYIGFVIIYQAGQQDITNVELWREDCQQWWGMRRAFGAVWDMANPPRGALNARLTLVGDNRATTSIQLNNAIPNDWKAGAVYDSAVQLN
ncbi:Expansin-like B1 [Acorus calamus]|uniref:Expansin-like B1 n=1 Tax=Acorus calamus TaxID=4465 RepID=A0AAV9DXY8_ACOCL|nr:Expansin-like B1 [Acorus calamus]